MHFLFPAPPPPPGEAGAVGPAALRGSGDDQRHDKRGGRTPAAPVPQNLHPPLRERQVSGRVLMSSLGWWWEWRRVGGAECLRKISVKGTRPDDSPMKDRPADKLLPLPVSNGV